MPTRRAFLIAGTTFAVGSALGGACGYSLGASTAGAPGDEALPSSGNVELDELRRLAVKAPIAELVEQRLFFIDRLTKGYPKDPVLWKGLERLVDAAVSKEPFPDRRVVSRWLAQVVEGGDPALTRNLTPRVGELRSQR